MDLSLFKDIPDYEGYYKAGPIGEIYSVVSDRLIGQNISNSGYLQVILCVKQRRRTLLSHRLIALTFISNSEQKCDVNHIDGNKTNNTVSNLEWSTRSENINHSFKLGLSKSNLPKYNKGTGHINNKPVIKIDKVSGIILKEYLAISEAVAEGFKASSISNCLTGKSKSSSGFIWKYKI